LIIPDPHAHPNFNNTRAEWLSKLIQDVKPDVVINMGDCADMASLSSYDQGKRQYQGRSYRADINSAVDFNDRLWSPIKKLKKKLPRRIVLEGNHEQRIERALDMSPELVGAIGWKDLRYNDYYDEEVRYTGMTPGVIDVDGVSYAHYFITGVSGRSISGEHPAYTILTKQFVSATQGHTHVLDYCERTRPDGGKLMGLICGVFQDYDSEWAGAELCKLWWRGVVIKRNVEDGAYDPQFVSLKALQREYGNPANIVSTTTNGGT
jgi:hypothetical protein